MRPESIRVFALCATANFAQSVAFSLFLHFPGLLKGGYSAGESEIGVLVAFASLAALLSGPLVGRTMDRWGRLPVLRSGNLLALLVFGLYSQVDAITPFLYVVRVLHGCAEGMLYASFFTYAADHIPSSRRAQGLALFGTSAMLAISVGGVFGDWLITIGGYSAVFHAASAAALGSLLLTIPLRESWRPRTGEQNAPRQLMATLAQPSLMPLWIVAWIYFFAMAGVFAFFKTYVMETGLGSVGAFFAIYTSTAIVQRVFFGWVPDRVGLERVLVPGLLSFAVGLVVLAIATRSWHLWLAAGWCGLGHGICFPTLLALVAQRARDSERGAAMAIYTTLDDGAVLVAGPALGLLIESAGYSMTFAVAAACVGAAIAVLLAWRRP